MSVRNTDIVEACCSVLQNVLIHRSQERCFLTAYQIWILLREQNHPICEQLVNNYGTAVGRHGGLNVGPAQRIAQALVRSQRIETHYLDNRRIHFSPIRRRYFAPSGQDCGIFRLRR